MDLRHRDRAVVALIDPKRETELRQVRFHRRGHIGILQLTGEKPAIERLRAMYLAERGRARRHVLEAAESLFTIRPELARHPPLHEHPAHGRRVRLEVCQLARVFPRQRVGNSGEELRHLHERPLDAAERRLEVCRMPRAIDGHAEIPRAREPRRQPADGRRDPRVAPHATREGAAVAHEHVHRSDSPQRARRTRSVEFAAKPQFLFLGGLAPWRFKIRRQERQEAILAASPQKNLRDLRVLCGGTSFCMFRISSSFRARR